jgi:hypothetical protein
MIRAQYPDKKADLVQDDVIGLLLVTMESYRRAHQWDFPAFLAISEAVWRELNEGPILFGACFAGVPLRVVPGYPGMWALATDL